MTTLQLHASQLPVDATPNRTVWRVETNDGDLDFTYIDNKYITAELFGYDDLATPLPLRTAAKLAIKSGNIHGDFYNPNTNRFVGLFVKR